LQRATAVGQFSRASALDEMGKTQHFGVFGSVGILPHTTDKKSASSASSIPAK
jgi:hypothetical protein